MAYEVIILGHLHMPLYFLGTFTEYPYVQSYLLLRPRLFENQPSLDDQATTFRADEQHQKPPLQRLPKIDRHQARQCCLEGFHKLEEWAADGITERKAFPMTNAQPKQNIKVFFS